MMAASSSRWATRGRCGRPVHRGDGDIVAQYQSEGFHGETMRVRWLARLQPLRLRPGVQRRMTEKASAGREVARGKIGIVFIGKASQATGGAPIPDSIRQLLLARLGMLVKRPDSTPHCRARISPST